MGKPARIRFAIETVDANRLEGTAADSGCAESIPTMPAAGNPTPRRVSRAASRSSARASRPESVPSDHPSRAAASFRDRPARWHSTTGRRYFSGRLRIASSRIVSRSASKDGRVLGFWPNRGLLGGHPAGCGPAGLEGHPAGHSVKPRPQPVGWARPIGLEGENEKRGLEGILGVLPGREHSATRAEYHRPVPMQKGAKRDFVVVVAEPAEQFAIGGAVGVVRQPGHLVQGRAEGQHAMPSGGFSTGYSRRAPRAYTFSMAGKRLRIGTGISVGFLRWP